MSTNRRWGVGGLHLVGAVLCVLGVLMNGPVRAKAPLPDEADASECKSPQLVSLERLADMGSLDAQYQAAVFILSNHCSSAQLEDAVRRLRAAADQGHAEAAYALAQIYSAVGVSDLPDQGYDRYLMVAAERGHAVAQHELGLAALRGEFAETPNSSTTANGLYWLGAAAAEGHGLSALILGFVHEQGLYGVAQDVCMARDWYAAGEVLGMKDAIDHLGRIDRARVCN